MERIMESLQSRKPARPPVRVLSVSFDIFYELRKMEPKENRLLLQAPELCDRMAPLARSSQNRTIDQGHRAGEI